MTKKGLITIAVLLLFAIGWNYAVAEEVKTENKWWLTATVRSYHFERGKDYNESNYGLGFEHDVLKNTRIIGGFYENSYKHTSNYFGVGWMPVHITPNLHFGVALGIVDGYKQHPFGGFVMPSLSYERKGWGVNLGVVPSEHAAFTVIGLQLKMRVD